MTEPRHREAYNRAKELVAAMRFGDKILHGSLQACIFASANAIDAENDRIDSEVRQWERDCEL